MVNHYTYLDKYFVKLLATTGKVQNPEDYKALILAHGDKCYDYRTSWEEAHVPFYEGVAIYLLTYISPWAAEVRETPEGWTAPKQWVIDNHHRFAQHFMTPGGLNDL